MSAFLPLEPNPFRVNAFTITGVRPDVTRSAEIDAEVKGRAHEIEDGRDCSIALTGGARHPVTIADLTQNEEVLRDPNRRHCQALLVPVEHPFQEPAAIAEFRQRHTLTPKAADTFLRLEPLDATDLLVSGLPEVPVERLVFPAAEPPAPALAPLRCAASALLVRARDRRG
jgi:hypothetical protein